MLAAVLSVSLRTPYISLDGSLLMELTEWKLSNNQTNLLTHRYFNNHRCVALAWHPNSYEQFWRRQAISVEQGMILLSAREVWLWVQRDGPKIIYRFTSIRKWVLRWWKRPFWFSKKIPLTFSSNCVFPYQGGCSQFLISSRKFDSSISGWKMNFPFSLGNITSFALSLLEWISDASIVSNSWRSATSASPSQTHPAHRAYPRNNPGKTFFPNWWILDCSFEVMGSYSTSEPNGMIGPSNGFPKRLSYGVFPSNKRFWTFRREVKHSMESAHQLSFRPDCNNTAEVPSFALRTALSAIPFVSDLFGVDVQWFQERSSQAFPNSKELSVLMTFGFSDGWRNFRLLPIYWKVFVLHG